MSVLITAARNMFFGNTTDGYSELHTRSYEGVTVEDAIISLNAEIDLRINDLYEAKAKLNNMIDGEWEEKTLSTHRHTFHKVKAELQRARETKVACEIAYKHFGSTNTEIYNQWTRINQAYDDAKGVALKKLGIITDNFNRIYKTTYDRKQWDALPLTQSHQKILENTNPHTLTDAQKIYDTVMGAIYYMPDKNGTVENENKTRYMSLLETAKSVIDTSPTSYSDAVKK